MKMRERWIRAVALVMVVAMVATILGMLILVIVS